MGLPFENGRLEAKQSLRSGRREPCLLGLGAQHMARFTRFTRALEMMAKLLWRPGRLGLPAPSPAAANLDNSARTPGGSGANSKSATAESREPQWIIRAEMHKCSPRTCTGNLQRHFRKP